MGLKYYWEQKHGFLSAYDQDTDFFVMFNKKQNAWVPAASSFQSFDYSYDDNVEIDKQQAALITNGVLPKQIHNQ